MSFINFNAENVEPADSFDVIPAGTYTAVITDSEIVGTKAGTGQMLRLTWQVSDGEHKGRLVWDRLNIVNQNPKAEEIGQRQLSSLCHAAGVLKLRDTEQLHGIPCAIRVIIRKDQTGQYADSNEVRGYSAVTHPAVVTTAPPFGAHAKPAAPAPSERKAPWL